MQRARGWIGLLAAAFVAGSCSTSTSGTSVDDGGVADTTAGCGAATEPCCKGTTCNSGLTCMSAVCFAPCGAAGEGCCSGFTCNAGLRCGGGLCQAQSEPDAAGPEAGPDAAVDATGVGPVEASVDAPPEASTDAAVEGGADASVDASLDAPTDAWLDGTGE